MREETCPPCGTLPCRPPRRQQVARPPICPIQHDDVQRTSRRESDIDLLARFTYRLRPLIWFGTSAESFVLEIQSLHVAVGT
ncbi:hypothetical protein J1614_010849 [Plenodomus biglobosus]|nr:hypothetical protein J1614_010849 [Plenodomus biglobosus]